MISIAQLTLNSPVGWQQIKIFAISPFFSLFLCFLHTNDNEQHRNRKLRNFHRFCCICIFNLKTFLILFSLHRNTQYRSRQCARDSDELFHFTIFPKQSRLDRGKVDNMMQKVGVKEVFEWKKKKYKFLCQFSFTSTLFSFKCERANSLLTLCTSAETLILPFRSVTFRCLFFCDVAINPACRL